MSSNEKQIIFKLQNDTPAGEFGAALKVICSVTEVFNVTAIFPAEKDAKLKTLYTATVAAGAPIDQVLKAVKDAPYVEYAHEPPVRKTSSAHR